MQAGTYGVSYLQPSRFQLERSSENNQTMHTSCRAQRSKAKRSSATLSLNPAVLPKKRLEMQHSSTSNHDGSSKTAPQKPKKLSATGSDKGTPAGGWDIALGEILRIECSNQAKKA